MIEQQLIIDQLNDKLEKMSNDSPSRSDCGDGPAPLLSAKRPYSVPLTKRLVQSINTPMGLYSRKVDMKFNIFLIIIDDIQKKQFSTVVNYHILFAWEDCQGGIRGSMKTSIQARKKNNSSNKRNDSLLSVLCWILHPGRAP